MNTNWHMKHMIKKSSGLVLIILIGLLLSGTNTSCKSKKKLAREQAAAEYAAKVVQAKSDLNAMIDGTSQWSLDEQDKRLEVIRSYNIDDPEVVSLIDKAGSVITMKRAELERKAEEERLRKIEEERKKAELSKYQPIESGFDAIAGAPNMETANSKINLALQQYATPDVPVLIIISQAGGFNDYDRPTTIALFLNYLKDKKQNNYKVETVKYDSQGKITELELIKK